MISVDVNVLVYAFREDMEQHVAYRTWLRERLRGSIPVGIADWVLSGFLRLVTHPKIFKTPTPLTEALTFVEILKQQPAYIPLEPGNQHWKIFLQLCRSAQAKGNLISDAFLAALAIEHGAEWVTADRDFARFQDLRWRHPLTA